VIGSPRVAIVGSGFSGIAAAVALERHGLSDFVIFEEADGLGGTWWKNRYPGAEVDLESHIYSFSFARHDWTRTHATWDQLLAYLQQVADDHGITPKVLLGEKVERVEWRDETQGYAVRTSSGRDHGEFSAVISAVGFLNVPVVPPFARGASDFHGTVCHTSSWPEGLDMTGKAVGVVGTGSSAVQVGPEAAKVAASVKVFQLEANWLIPKDARDFTPAERRFNRRRLGYALRRWRLYWMYEARQVLGRHVIEGTRTWRKRATLAREYLERSLGDRPELLRAVTPDYPFEGKRVVLSDTYYEMLRSDHVTLVPHAVVELTREGVRDAAGEEHALDIVVLATGFDAANYLGNYEVYGRDGIELHDRWQGEPEALLGMMVPGFPNFFIMYGPNTNSVPLVSFYEAQARFAARLIARVARRRRGAVEAREDVFVAYNKRLQRRLSKTVWYKASNYFQASTGKVVSQWPLSATAYILALRLAERLAVRFHGEADRPAGEPIAPERLEPELGTSVSRSG
jgi:cation diffusion facilitator CzcD-associated flavoprotein CzcO